MQNENVMTRPHPGSVTLHWLGAALLFPALLAGLFAVYYSSGCCAADRRVAFLLHAYAGLAVLGIVVLRLMLRARYSWPAAAHAGKARLGHVVALLSHSTLYGMMIMIPLTGWIMASDMGCCWYVPGLPDVNLLSLGTSDWSMADIAAAYRVHVALVWLIIGLITLHVAAALFQHLFQNNDVLRRMLPGRMLRNTAENDGRAVKIKGEA